METKKSETAKPGAAKPMAVFLKGGKTVLCPPSKDDLPTIIPLVNDEETRQYVAMYLPASEQAEEEWLNDLAKKSQTDIVFIVKTLDGEFVGIMGIHRINWKDRTAVTGAMLVERFRGKGYGTDAKMTMLAYAFNTLNLYKVCSSVIAFNKRSLAYSAKCGYKIEGVKRKQIFKKGRYYNEVLLGVFKPEWRAAWKKWRNRERGRYGR